MENSFTTIKILCLLLGIAATTQAQEVSNLSNGDLSEHHNWSKGRIIQKATCTTEGLISYICLDDGCDSTKEEIVAPLGHEFNNDFIVDLYPTCTDEGSKSRHCVRCSQRDDIKSVPAIGHKWDKGDTLQHATCMENGEIRFHCYVNGCGATQTEELPSLGHQWDEGETTTEPTCTQRGTKSFACLHPHCDVVRREAIRETGHTFNTSFTIDKEPTCEMSGNKSQHCLYCEERINLTIIPATGHAWGESSIIRNATCTEAGLLEIQCTHNHCGAKISQEIAATGHHFPAEYITDITATCSHNGSKSRHCAHCDIHFETIEIPALAHISGDTVIERVIAPCCHKEGQQDEVVYCTICKGETYRKTVILPAKEHNWDEGKYTIYPTTSNKGKRVYTCRDCMMTRNEIVDKLYEEIALLKDNRGESFRVSKEGFCPGSENFISYTISQGTPTEYKVSFDNDAQEAGFENIDWTEAPSDNKIAILTPENCKAGRYTAHVTFKDETGKETNAIGFSFRVNLPPTLTVAIFNDVVSIDNRGQKFTSFQWYHNGTMVDGANKPYLQEMGGLTGSYYVKLNIGTAEETMTCPRENWDEIPYVKKEIILSPNPMTESATLQLNQFSDERHLITIINEVGTPIYSGTFEGEEFHIDCHHYASGKYIINVDGTTLKAIKK